MAQESKAAEAQSATAWASSLVARGRVVVNVVVFDSPSPPSLSAGQRRSAFEASAAVTSASSPLSTLANSTFQASLTLPEHASEAPPLGPASSVTVAANEPASNSGVRPS